MRNAVHIPQLRYAADLARRPGIGSPTHWIHEIITHDVIARNCHQDGSIDDAQGAFCDPQPGSGPASETII